MTTSRRSFLRTSSLAIAPAVTGLSLQSVFAQEAGLTASDALQKRFQIGIQEYTFHRWIKDGKLDHLDYPALAKDKLGIDHIEYWSRPFAGKHTDKAYVGELAKRSTGEGMTNVLILVDIGNQIDATDVAERQRSVDEHKAWIDCAAQLGCKAIRVNCKSGGDREENLKNMADGLGALCDYAKGSGVMPVIEPHGGNSKDPDWLLAAMKRLDRPNAGLLPDFNNFGDYDRYSAVEKTLPHAVAVCAKALGFNDDGTETNTDFGRMLKIIHDFDFSGVITIEFEGHNMDPVDGALKTKDLIWKSLEAAAGVGA